MRYNRNIKEYDSVICDDDYEFEDFLRDNGVDFIKENEFEYYVIDSNNEKTGDVFIIMNEEPINEIGLN